MSSDEAENSMAREASPIILPTSGAIMCTPAAPTQLTPHEIEPDSVGMGTPPTRTQTNPGARETGVPPPGGPDPPPETGSAFPHRHDFARKPKRDPLTFE